MSRNLAVVASRPVIPVVNVVLQGGHSERIRFVSRGPRRVPIREHALNSIPLARVEERDDGTTTSRLEKLRSLRCMTISDHA